MRSSPVYHADCTGSESGHPTVSVPPYVGVRASHEPGRVQDMLNAAPRGTQMSMPASILPPKATTTSPHPIRPPHPHSPGLVREYHVES